MATNLNPYLASMGNAITQQANQNLQYNVLPGINSGAVAAGGYGGSRHGIAQGQAIGMNQQGISNALANMYGQAYEGDQTRSNTYNIASMQDKTNRYGINKNYSLGQAGLANTKSIAELNNETNRYGIDQNYGLGMANNAVNKQNADTNATSVANQYNLGVGGLYNTANANATNAALAGSNIYTQGLNNAVGVGNTLYENGQRELNAPNDMNAEMQKLIAPYLSATGSGTSTGPTTGGGVAGAIGGGLTAAQLYQLLMGNKP